MALEQGSVNQCYSTILDGCIFVRQQCSVDVGKENVSRRGHYDGSPFNFRRVSLTVHTTFCLFIVSVLI